MRRARREQPVWGTSGGDEGRVWMMIGGGAVIAVLATVGLGFLMAAMLRAGIEGDTPLRATAGLGGVMIAALAGAIVALRAAARRFADGSSARNAVTVGGVAVLMGCAPLLMIVVVLLLVRG